MNSAYKIGVLDSGAGGLSVLSAIIKINPACEWHYFADDAFSPYGALPLNLMRQRVVEICLFLIDKGVDALVLACNTATVETISLIRSLPQVMAKNIEVVGVEPAIKPASVLGRGVVSVLATPVTCRSERLLNLVNTHQTTPYQDVSFQIIASHVLANAIDALPNSQCAVEQELARIKEVMDDVGSSVLVLACTHYPLIKRQFERLFDHNIHIIEPSQAVADQVFRCLSRVELVGGDLAREGYLTFYSSGSVLQVERLPNWLQSLLGEVCFQALSIHCQSASLIDKGI